MKHIKVPSHVEGHKHNHVVLRSVHIVPHGGSHHMNGRCCVLSSLCIQHHWSYLGYITLTCWFIGPAMLLIWYNSFCYRVIHGGNDYFSSRTVVMYYLRPKIIVLDLSRYGCI